MEIKYLLVDMVYKVDKDLQGKTDVEKMEDFVDAVLLLDNLEIEYSDSDDEYI